LLQAQIKTDYLKPAINMPRTGKGSYGVLRPMLTQKNLLLSAIIMFSLILFYQLGT